MHSDALITGDWLEPRLGDPGLRILQLSRADLDDWRRPPARRRPGLVEGPLGRLRSAIPTPAQMAERLGAESPNDPRLYSGRNHYAMYAYWVTKEMCGHADVRVLDGGKKRWTLDGRPLTTDVPVVEAVAYPAPARERDDSSRVFRDDVRAGLGR
jgi:thiosulfate/3-mercaptopyruvate sulfurtransferase